MTHIRRVLLVLTRLVGMAGVCWCTPSVGRTLSPGGSTGTSGTGFVTDRDGSATTSAMVSGTLISSGSLISGSGVALDSMDTTLSIHNLPNRQNNTEAGRWEVTLQAEVEISVFVNNYSAGDGMYYAQAIGSASLTSPQGGSFSSSATVEIYNEGTLQFQTVYFSATFTADANVVSLDYYMYCFGNIITSRPQVEVNALSEEGTPFASASYAIAYDAADMNSPVALHTFTLE